MKKLFIGLLLGLAAMTGTAEAKNDKTPVITVTKIAGRTFVSVIEIESASSRIAWCKRQKVCAKIGTYLEHDVYVREAKLANGKLLVQFWYINKLQSLKISQIVRKALKKKFGVK